MKYERLTIKRENGFSTVRNTTLQGVIDRLAKLEDKIESGELVDRNEYLDRLMAAKDISGMADREIEFFAKHNARVREAAFPKMSRLIDENAELRARLEKAEELPCKVGDTVYLICDVGARKVIRKYKVDGFMYDGEIGWRISIEIACPQISLIGDRIFFTRAAAEARLKELQGGER